MKKELKTATLVNLYTLTTTNLDTVSKALANSIPCTESKGRHGRKVQVTPRTKIEMWSNPDTSGDLWVSDSLFTDEMRKVVDEVATYTDSPWGRKEKRITLKNDTFSDRVSLFRKMIAVALA